MGIANCDVFDLSVVGTAHQGDFGLFVVWALLTIGDDILAFFGGKYLNYKPHLCFINKHRLCRCKSFCCVIYLGI